jgi:predicted methyltransferase
MVGSSLLFVAALIFSHAHAGETDIAAIRNAIASERLAEDRAQDDWRKPEAVLQFMDLAPGQHVLDYFSGPGYYTELIAKVVGPSGAVYAYNNELYAQAAYSGLMKRLGRQRLPNAHMIKGAPNYLQLDADSLDRVLFAMVYHDLYWQPSGSADAMGDPKKVLAILYAALKSGGLVVVVDHVATDTARDNVTPVANRMHRIDPNIVRADFEQAGFEFVAENAALRDPADDHTKSVFNPAVRRHTDQFIYKFRKP